MIMGASYKLPIACNRGRRESEVLKIKGGVSRIIWATNYVQRWIGGGSECLIPMNLVMNARRLENAEIKADMSESEYYMGVDVARSEDETNNQTSIMIVKVTRSSNGRVASIKVPFLTNIKGTVKISDQTVIIKRLARQFNVKCVVYDAIVLGVGFGEQFIVPSYDAENCAFYDSWEHIDKDFRLSNDPQAISEFYPLKAQCINHNIILNFQNLFTEGII